MSPLQCAPFGDDRADDAAGGQDARPADDDAWPAADAAAGPLELMRFATEYMRQHGTWVQAMETENGEPGGGGGGLYDRDTRRTILESLVIVSHVAHSFLRHPEPEVRDAAETLTTGTAALIGRLFHAVHYIR